MELLGCLGISIGGYVVSIGGVEADLSAIPLARRPGRAEECDVRCPDPAAAEAMRAAIQEVIEKGDTLGGVVEVTALGLPPGLGSHVHWDRRLDSRLGAAVLGIQAIKGFEIGPAFENSRLPGTEVHDAIRLEGENLARPTNRCGGLEGGMTTGQPLVIRAAMKPIATTLQPQQTVDLVSRQETQTTYERSDFCPVPRAVPVVEAIVAFVLADALLEKTGGDSLAEIKPRFEALRQAGLDDLEMDGTEHIFWPAPEDNEKDEDDR